MGPTNNLNFLLQHLAAVIGKRSEQILQAQVGIGLSQYRILMVLEWNPRVTQSAIAKSLGQTEASISRQMTILEKRGLLKTQADPANKRKHIASPTPLGMQMTESASTSLRRTLGPEFALLGDNHVSELTASLQKLHAITCRPGRIGSCNHVLGI